MSNDFWQRPYKDELLSSWLSRVALHSGCDPLTLTGAIWPKWRIWTIDVDRRLTTLQAMRAAVWFECEPDVVHAATLSNLADRLAGVSEQSRPVVPWIIALGSRNRRRYAGLPCCPQCLASDSEPFFRRAWRLAFCVGCEIHGTRLIDRCPYCSALVAPHLCINKLQNLARCSACGQDIRRYTPTTANDKAMRFQRMAIEVLSIGEGLWECDTVSGVDWFRRMRRMLAPSRCLVVRSDFQEPALRPNNLMFELQSPLEREARLSKLVTMLQTKPAPKPRHVSGLPDVARKSLKAEKLPIPVAKELVQADWERWLRKNRLW